MVSTPVISKTTRNIVNKGKKTPEFSRQEVRKEIWRPKSGENRIPVYLIREQTEGEWEQAHFLRGNSKIIVVHV